MSTLERWRCAVIQNQRVIHRSMRLIQFISTTKSPQRHAIWNIYGPLCIRPRKSDGCIHASIFDVSQAYLLLPGKDNTADTFSSKLALNRPLCNQLESRRMLVDRCQTAAYPSEIAEEMPTRANNTHRGFGRPSYPLEVKQTQLITQPLSIIVIEIISTILRSPRVLLLQWDLKTREQQKENRMGSRRMTLQGSVKIFRQAILCPSERLIRGDQLVLPIAVQQTITL